eukprot:100740_1
MSHSEDLCTNRNDSSKWTWVKKLIYGCIICTGIHTGRVLTNYFYRKYYHYPPGPVGLPFAGCVAYMKNEKSFYTYLTNAFGPVSMFFLGLHKRIILINDTEIFCKLANHKHCLYRPTSAKTQTEPVNLVIANGKEWQYHRKLMFKFITLINNSTFMESKLTHSIQNTLLSHIERTIQSNPNHSFNFNEHFYYISFHIIFSCIFDAELSFDSTEYQTFYKMSLLETNSGQNIAPVVSLFFGYQSTFLLKLFSNKIEQNVQRRKKIMREYTFPVIRQWFETYFDVKLLVKENQIILNDKQQFDALPDVTYGKLMIAECLDNVDLKLDELLAETRVLFRAGIDGVAETANYGVVLIAKPQHLKIQDMVYEELQREMHKHNLNAFSLKILKHLHLFRALVYEILRISSVARSGVSRLCISDVVMDEYVIPKGSIIMPNLSYCHVHDEAQWGKEPRKIELNHWLDENRKFKYNHKFIGFGFGKRDCPGKTFAIKTMYFIFGMLMQRFRFTLRKDVDIVQNYEKVRKMVPQICVTVQQRSLT